MGNETKKNVQVEDVKATETEEQKAQGTKPEGNPPEDDQGQQTPPKKDNIFKRAAKKVGDALDHEIKFTPKKVLVAIGVTAAAVIGVKLVYEKGKQNGKEDAAMENALEGGDEMLALPGEEYEEVAQDIPEESEVVDVTDYEEEEQYEEAEEYVEE